MVLFILLIMSEMIIILVVVLITIAAAATVVTSNLQLDVFGATALLPIIIFIPVAFRLLTAGTRSRIDSNNTVSGPRALSWLAAALPLIRLTVLLLLLLFEDFGLLGLT